MIKAAIVTFIKASKSKPLNIRTLNSKKQSIIPAIILEIIFP